MACCFRLIQFIENNQTRLPGKSLAVKIKFFEKILIIVRRSAPLLPGGIDKNDQPAAALDVAQESVTKAPVRVSSFNEAGDVSQLDAGEVVGWRLHDTNHRIQGCERIACGLRLGSREGADQG